MRRTLLFILILSFMLGLGACGSSSKPAVVTPQTTSFAFLQETANLSYEFTPMLGQFSTTGTTTQFTAKPAAIDASANSVVSGPFWSLALSADNKKAVFDLYGGMDGTLPQWAIIVANSDGTGTTIQLNTDGYDGHNPQFSPNGVKVVYASYRPITAESYQWQIVTANADGTGQVVLPVPAGVLQETNPTYSPDGTKIAMEAWGYDESDTEFAGIFVMNADGSNPVMLTNPYSSDCWCWDELASYTPDGSKIVFSRDNWTNTPEVEDIFSINSDGTGLTQLSDGVGLNIDPLVMSVNGVGTKIVFPSNRDNQSLPYGAGFDLYTMSLDGSGLTRLTTNSLWDAFSYGWWYDESPGGTAMRTQGHHRRMPLQTPLTAKRIHRR
jgi:Tol biopolymer transport system component